ncbi:MAG TPA: rod shape-determining protein MreC [Vicinamibacteria bacterium]|nr:rod shape-determining protein MreC [Vicinamibacteria bacterium]
MATTTSAPLGSRGGHLVFGLVLVLQALLLSSQVTTEGGHSALRALLIGLFSPIQRGADAALGAFSSMWYGYVDLRGVREENGRLKEDVARLEQALWMERDLIASYRRLSSVLEFAERIPGNPIVAEVVGLDASAWFRTITVNRGTAHGVALNAPVIAAGGLVGRVIAIGSDVAQIQLLTDRDCSVGALLARTRARGVVAGSGEQASPTGLTLNYVSNLEDVVEGDLIVTSGMDGIYPKGIAIGRVGSVRNGPRLFKIVTVEPAANLDRLEEVFILEAASVSEVIERVE